MKEEALLEQLRRRKRGALEDYEIPAERDGELILPVGHTSRELLGAFGVGLGASHGVLHALPPGEAITWFVFP